LAHIGLLSMHRSLSSEGILPQDKASRSTHLAKQSIRSHHKSYTSASHKISAVSLQMVLALSRRISQNLLDVIPTRY
jgi:hypothetical protein